MIVDGAGRVNSKKYPAPYRGPDSRQAHIRIGPVRAAVRVIVPANGILEKISQRLPPIHLGCQELFKYPIHAHRGTALHFCRSSGLDNFRHQLLFVLVGHISYGEGAKVNEVIRTSPISSGVLFQLVINLFRTHP